MTQPTRTNWSGHNRDKDRLRTKVWSSLKQRGVSLGEPFGHIPHFVGAEDAARRLSSLPIWRRAKTVMCTPDKPQTPVRLQALRDGKCLYMAVPRLTDTRCFVELLAEDLTQRNVYLKDVATKQGAMVNGQLIP